MGYAFNKSERLAGILIEISRLDEIKDKEQIEKLLKDAEEIQNGN